MDEKTKKYDEKGEVIHASETATATVKMTGGRITKFSGFESESDDEPINHVDEDQNKNTSDRNSHVEVGRRISEPINRADEEQGRRTSDVISSEGANNMDIPETYYRKRSVAFSESFPDKENTKIVSRSLERDIFNKKAASTTHSLPAQGVTSGTRDKHSPESSDLAMSESSSNTGSPSKDVSFPRERFNPFDRDILIDDEHFSDSSTNYFRQHGTQSSSSRSDTEASENWTDIMGSHMSDADEVTYADLGLAEDHFSHPEVHFGLSSAEELDLAIENCVELIKLAPQNSDKQKNLVRKLVQLRMKKQELREGPELCSPDVKMVVGHKFREKMSRSSKHYCEKCNGVIWGMLQAWYRCLDCHYSCHAKCLILITRTCAKVRVTENPTYGLSICPQKGLASQNYRCAECKSPLSFKSGSAEPRLCDYNGCYYCEFCHWNDTMVIPARVMHNWDFMPRKVCRASKQFLKLMSGKAVLRIQDVNPMLFNFVEELSEIKKLREEMLIMKKYILLCPSAMKQKLLLLLQSRQHFVEGSDIYSMRDLLDTQTDTMLSELAQVHSQWAQHIKTDCELCQARGFFCEMCEEKEVLFPFDNIAVVCSQCSNVIHRHCYAKRGQQCPRCERRDRRKAN